MTNGEYVFRLPGGSAMMTKIIGAGCSLGGVTATYLAVAEPLVAAISASLLYNRASEIAEAKSSGPGSFKWRCSMRFGTSQPRKSPPPKSSSTRLCRTLHTMRHVMQGSAIAYAEYFKTSDHK